MACSCSLQEARSDNRCQVTFLKEVADELTGIAPSGVQSSGPQQSASFKLEPPIHAPSGGSGGQGLLLSMATVSSLGDGVPS